MTTVTTTHDWVLLSTETPSEDVPRSLVSDRARVIRDEIQTSMKEFLEGKGVNLEILEKTRGLIAELRITMPELSGDIDELEAFTEKLQRFAELSVTQEGRLKILTETGSELSMNVIALRDEMTEHMAAYDTTGRVDPAKVAITKDRIKWMRTALPDSGDLDIIESKLDSFSAASDPETNTVENTQTLESVESSTDTDVNGGTESSSTETDAVENTQTLESINTDVVEDTQTLESTQANVVENTESSSPVTNVSGDTQTNGPDSSTRTTDVDQSVDDLVRLSDLLNIVLSLQNEVWSISELKEPVSRNWIAGVRDRVKAVSHNHKTPCSARINTVIEKIYSQLSLMYDRSPEASPDELVLDEMAKDFPKDHSGDMTPFLERIIGLLQRTRRCSIRISNVEEASLTEDGSFCVIERKWDIGYFKSLIIANTRTMTAWSYPINSHGTYFIHKNVLVIKRTVDFEFYDMTTRSTKIVDPGIGFFSSSFYNKKLRQIALRTPGRVHVFSVQCSGVELIRTIKRKGDCPVSLLGNGEVV